MRALFLKHARGADIAVLEGAMGYFDGVGGSDQASAYDLARATKTPVILVVEAKGRSLSLAAALEGFSNFRKDSNLRGVILNRCEKSLYAHLEKSSGKSKLEPLGFLPPVPEAALKAGNGAFDRRGNSKFREKISFFPAPWNKTSM